MPDGVLLNRRSFLRVLGAAVAACGVGGAAAADSGGAGVTARRPNIVLILVDDMGWTDVGCFGSTFYKTPHIDRLCAQGMKFTNGYAACAVCSPTRAALMTGRYPVRLVITDWIRPEARRRKVADAAQPEYEDVGRALACPANASELALSEMTLAEALKEGGYATCHVGKWHLGARGFWPEDQGFDENHGGCAFGQPPSYFDPYGSKTQKGIPTLAPRKQGEYLTDRLGDEAVRFIREHREGPFFLYMAHYAVHVPLQGKKEVVEKYRARRNESGQKNATYAAMVESVDDSVGKILATLDELRLAENTVVIFTSDNGGLLESTSNAPLRAGKGYPYEGGIRVPLIVRWPGVVPATSTCDVPVVSMDFFPTCCALAGVRGPENRAIDGRDLGLLLKQKGTLEREALYWHFPHYRGEVVPYSVVRCGEWKLIKRYEGKAFELFNLREDVSEKNDLAERRPEKVRELDAKLTAWLKETGAKMPRPKGA